MLCAHCSRNSAHPHMHVRYRLVIPNEFRHITDLSKVRGLFVGGGSLSMRLHMHFAAWKFSASGDIAIAQIPRYSLKNVALTMLYHLTDSLDELLRYLALEGAHLSQVIPQFNLVFRVSK